jgi:hypothetical protein
LNNFIRLGLGAVLLASVRLHRSDLVDQTHARKDAGHDHAVIVSHRAGRLDRPLATAE